MTSTKDLEKRIDMEANGDAHELPVRRATVRAGKYGAVNLDRNTQGQASAPSPAHSKGKEIEK